MMLTLGEAASKLGVQHYQIAYHFNIGNIPPPNKHAQSWVIDDAYYRMLKKYFGEWNKRKANRRKKKLEQ